MWWGAIHSTANPTESYSGPHTAGDHRESGHVMRGSALNRLDVDIGLAASYKQSKNIGFMGIEVVRAFECASTLLDDGQNGKPGAE